MTPEQDRMFARLMDRARELAGNFDIGCKSDAKMLARLYSAVYDNTIPDEAVEELGLTEHLIGDLLAFQEGGLSNLAEDSELLALLKGNAEELAVQTPQGRLTAEVDRSDANFPGLNLRVDKEIAVVLEVVDGQVLIRLYRADEDSPVQTLNFRTGQLRGREE